MLKTNILFMYKLSLNRRYSSLLYIKYIIMSIAMAEIYLRQV